MSRVKQTDDDWPSLWPKPRHVRPFGPLAVLEKVLAGQPKLPGARCTRHPDLFDDPDDQALVPIALAICRHSCPSATRSICLAWARSEPAGTVRGVVGGELFGATA